MLAGELRFYKNGKIVKTVDSEEYEIFSAAELKGFVEKLANEFEADKVVENCIYHNQHSGINTTIFSTENVEAST